MKKRLLSVLLVIVLIINIMPVCVWAKESLQVNDYGTFVDGETVIDDIINKYGENVHPRLIMTEERFAMLRSHIGDGSVTDTLLKDLRSEAENIISRKANKPAEEAIKYAKDGDEGILEMSKKVQRNVATFALAYNIFGDKKYARYAYADLEAACNFPDWNPHHFLDTAELCTAFAYAYDWLYHWMTPEQRDLIRTTLIEKGLKQVMVDYTKSKNEYSRSYYWYLNNEGDNWQFVCTGGTNLAALAIADESDARDIASQVITYSYKRAYYCVRLGYGAVDGSYKEGLGYWDYATYYLGLQSSALKSATGTDYGLADFDGVERSADWVLSMSSNTHISFDFGDDRTERRTDWAVFLWLGEQLNLPALSAIRLENLANKPKGQDFNYLDVLWIDESKQTGEKLNKKTDAGFVGASDASFRTNWNKSGLVSALHLGKNDYVFHGHFDLGSFYIESNGQRFFTHLGNENYQLKDRKYSYRIKAEGHNTLVINPTWDIDQADLVQCLVTEYKSGNEAYAVTDLTAAYAPSGANKVIRGMKMIKDKECVIIQDEISLNNAGEIYWFAHTKGQIRVSSDGKSAIVTVGSDRLWVQLLSSDGQFTVMDAKPLPTSMNVPGATDNSEYGKLAIHLTNTRDTTISVAFIPLKSGETSPSWTPSVKEISEWSNAGTADFGEKLCGCTLSLSGDIGVNFYMDLSKATLSDDAYVEFDVPSGNKTVTRKIYVKAKAGEDRTVAETISEGNTTYHIFKCQVSAKDVASTIGLRMVDGGEYGRKYNYSVKQYADTLLSQTNVNAEYKKAEPLVKALVCYCTWAQDYFEMDASLIDENYRNYNTVSSVTAQEVTAAAPATKVSLDKLSGVTFEGATISLKSETTLSLYFSSSEKLTFSCNRGNKLETSKVDGYQVVRIRGIAAYELDEVFEMKVTCGGKNDTVRYSVMNYMSNIFNGEYSDTWENLVKALYLYHKAAVDYIK